MWLVTLVRARLGWRAGNRASTRAGGFWACGGFPGSESGVARDGGGVFLACGEQFPAAEPAYGGLDGALGNTDILGEFLVADLNGGVAASLLDGEPKIDQKADGASIVTDEVAQEHVSDVVVEGRHRYTNS